MLNIVVIRDIHYSLYHQFHPQWYHLYPPLDVQYFSENKCHRLVVRKMVVWGTKIIFGPQVMLINHFIFKSILKMLHLLAMMRNLQNLAQLYISSDACLITLTNLANNFEKILHCSFNYYQLLKISQLL